MKKTLLMLFAAAAFVGCERADRVDEPAGAEIDVETQQTPGTNDTNYITDPSGAYSPQSGGGQQSTGGQQSGAGNP